jgi:hypothetical protein
MNRSLIPILAALTVIALLLTSCGGPEQPKGTEAESGIRDNADAGARDQGSPRGVAAEFDRLKPQGGDEGIGLGRSVAYDDSGQLKRSIEARAEAIGLRPQDGDDSIQRGVGHDDLGQQRLIEDDPALSQRSIEGDDDSGLSQRSIEGDDDSAQFQRSIEDNNEAIRQDQPAGSRGQVGCTAWVFRRCPVESPSRRPASGLRPVDAGLPREPLNVPSR